MVRNLYPKDSDNKTDIKLAHLHTKGHLTVTAVQVAKEAPIIVPIIRRKRVAKYSLIGTNCYRRLLEYNTGCFALILSLLVQDVRRSSKS